MLHITAIPAFDDNYLWLITEQPLAHNKESTNRESTNKEFQGAYVVDPGDGQVVQHMLQAQQLTLNGIFITHRHHDHIDGIAFLCEQHQKGASLKDTPPLSVYGPLSDAIPQITYPVYEGDSITLFDQYTFTVLETPGHTTEHIVYFLEDAQNDPLLFCGDTLFAAGCGRLSGGTAEQLHNSLRRLATLPHNTQVYCAHEYTLANLQFAQAVEPNNRAIEQRIQSAQHRRSRQQATVPFMLKEEINGNPFLRTHLPDVKAAVQQHCQIKEAMSDSQTFSQLRRWKDHF
jgi:hydroxyacylglutathione hydrolase